MNRLGGLQPRDIRYNARYQARLDAETSSKLEDLAAAFRRKRSAILRSVMQWGLCHSEGWTVDQSPIVAVPPVPVLLEPELLQQVHNAAAAHGASIAAWLREAVRRVTADDFPASWRTGERADRSHESGYCHRKFGLRLDDVTSRKLEGFTATFHRPAAEIIRQRIAQARPEDFPQSWQMAIDERRETRRRNGLQ
jgi:predicted transcriptional regulator